MYMCGGGSETHGVGGREAREKSDRLRIYDLFLIHNTCLEQGVFLDPFLEVEEKDWEIS